MNYVNYFQIEFICTVLFLFQPKIHWNFWIFMQWWKFWNCIYTNCVIHRCIWLNAEQIYLYMQVLVMRPLFCLNTNIPAKWESDKNTHALAKLAIQCYFFFIVVIFGRVFISILSISEGDSLLSQKYSNHSDLFGLSNLRWPTNTYFDENVSVFFFHICIC